MNCYKFNVKTTTINTLIVNAETQEEALSHIYLINGEPLNSDKSCKIINTYCPDGLSIICIGKYSNAKDAIESKNKLSDKS